MFYERIREKEQVKEKESETEDIDEIFMNQSSEGTHQLTTNDDLNQNTAKQYENYVQKENQNYINKVNIKNYLSPYLSKLKNDYTNNEIMNNENNYVVSNGNETNYEQKSFNHNEKPIRKNEADINNYRTTEDNTKSFNYQQNETASKYDSKTKKNNPILNDNKEKKSRRLNFSYDGNTNNFDNYNQIRNIKDKKDLVKYEYNNITFNQKLDTENSASSKNLKLGYKINNVKQDKNKNTNYYSQKNLNIIGENKLENEEKLLVKKYQKKIENVNINSDMKNGKEIKLMKQEIKNINYINNTQKTDNEEVSLKQPNYYFSYDYSTKIKNYDNNNSEKSEMSTAINTAKYKNYPDNQNNEVKVKEFNIMEETNQNENKNYKTQYITNNKSDYALNQKEQNYINNLKILKSELNEENSKPNSFIKTYKDIKNISNNINNKKDLGQKLKYYNSTNNLIINEMKQREKETIRENQKITDNNDISSLLQKEYTNIKIINAPQENIIINNKNSNEKYSYINPPEYNKNQIIINNTPKKKEIEIPYSMNNNNMPMIQDQNNLNTLESAVIRNMDEEEEIRTLELEKERQKLAQLEKEKQKLINEEKERRDRIMKEIQRQEEQYLERKKYMRKKYDEKMKKKREDEEKLIRIKEEQKKQLEEIYELKNNRKYDEQKLLMLTEGKFNRKQRNDYMTGISNKTLNSNNLPFRINIDENNTDYLMNKTKNNNIDKSSKYWNFKNNIIEIGDRNSIDNSIENDENDDNYEENIIKDNLDFEEIENNSDDIEENKFKSINEFDGISEDKKQKTDRDTENNDIFNVNNKEKENKPIYKPKNRRMNINNNNPLIKNSNNNNIGFKTFSPKITLKTKLNNFSPVIEQDINKISTELPEISKENLLEENHKNEKDNKEINENVFKIDNEIIVENEQKINDLNDKEYYEKKKFSFNRRKDIKDNNIKTKYTSPKKGSFAKLNELREITSKLASEVEKKIELINKNKLISKTKSSPRLEQTYTQFDYKKFKINSDLENNMNNEFNTKEIINKENDKEKENNKEKEKEKEKLHINKSNKYNQLIKETRIEISNIINNNHNQSSKTKSLIKEKVLPEEIKKECITELKKIETIAKRKGKENIQSNTDKINKIIDSINRNKNISTLKTYKTATNFNQKMFYNEYLYSNKKKIKGQDINQKFLPYYKEIYGEATPEKDV